MNWLDVFPFEGKKWARQEQVIECFRTSSQDENLCVNYKACLPCIVDTIYRYKYRISRYLQHTAHIIPQEQAQFKKKVLFL